MLLSSLLSCRHQTIRTWQSLNALPPSSDLRRKAGCSGGVHIILCLCPLLLDPAPLPSFFPVTRALTALPAMQTSHLSMSVCVHNELVVTAPFPGSQAPTSPSTMHQSYKPRVSEPIFSVAFHFSGPSQHRVQVCTLSSTGAITFP